MSASETILQAVRAVFITVTGAAADKVMVAGDKGPRPAKPYVTVRVTAARSGFLGTAERINTIVATLPNAAMRERREATVSIQGYGPGAATWLDTFAIDLDSPSSLAAQETAGASLILLAGPSDLSTFLDTQEEDRTSLELRVRHILTGAAQVLTPLAAFDLSGDIDAYPGDPDPLPIEAVYP